MEAESASRVGRPYLKKCRVVRLDQAVGGKRMDGRDPSGNACARQLSAFSFQLSA
jgi:hypothetical protein